MGLSVQCLDETELLQAEDLELVKNLLVTAANSEELTGDLEISVTFVDRQQIQAINKEYRQIDEPTDVISFALEEAIEDEVEILGIELPRLLGEIVISVPIAKEQAGEYNHSFHRELGFLAVHGFLHLLGYDHMSEDDERTMFEKQETILEEYGLKR